MLRVRVAKLIPFGIIAFWLVMMTWLVRREVFVPRLGAEADDRLLSQPVNTWLGVYSTDDRPVGFVHVRAEAENRADLPGRRMMVYAKLRMALLDQPTEIRVHGTAWASSKGELADLEFRLDSGGHEMRVEGFIERGELRAVIHTAGETIPMSVPIGEAVLLSDGLGTMLHIPPLEVGEEFRVRMFDPLTLSLGEARLRCVKHEEAEVAGDKVRTRVVTITSGGVTSTAWVTDTNEVVRAEMPFGLVLKKLSAEEAATLRDGGEVGDMLPFASIRPEGKTVFRGARRMAVCLSRLGRSAEAPVDDTQQETASGTYVVTAPVITEGAGYRPVTDAAHAEALASDAFVQSGHPDIQRTAEAIVGDERDLWRSAVLLYEWVYAQVAKRVVASIPSALDVLASREGDCSEHTVLFAALARSVGIPTRMAIGLVWSDEHDGFYYHAWPEVFTGARWVWMDPTLGQPVADATHIKLASGNIGEWLRLVPFLGQLDIEVTDIE